MAKAFASNWFATETKELGVATLSRVRQRRGAPFGRGAGCYFSGDKAAYLSDVKGDGVEATRGSPSMWPRMDRGGAKVVPHPSARCRSSPSILSNKLK